LLSGWLAFECHGSVDTHRSHIPSFAERVEGRMAVLTADGNAEWLAAERPCVPNLDDEATGEPFLLP